MEKPFLKIFKILTFLTLFLITSPALAQAPPSTCQPACPPGAVICIPNPLKYCSFEDLIKAIVQKFLFPLALAIAPLMIIIAGFYFVTAGGDPRRIETAKSIILYTLIGLFIIFLAYGIIGVIAGLTK